MYKALAATTILLSLLNVAHAQTATAPTATSTPAAPPPGATPPADPTLREQEASYNAAVQKEAQRIADAKEKGQDDGKKEEALRQFAGINFGVALGLLYAINDRRVEKATLIPSGEQMIVRATLRSTAAARVLLETHYFFSPKDYPRFGHGPFILVQPGADELIVSVGLGYMIGFRRDVKESSSFNIGVAMSCEPSATVLGAGIAENKPLPAGETEIRFQKKAVMSIATVASFSF